MTREISCTVFTAMHQGPRAAQEDCIINGRGLCQENRLKDLADFSTDRLVLAVCDGMGGHERGEAASRFVCQEFQTRMTNAFPGSAHISGILWDIQKSACGRLYQNSGTTIAGLIVDGDGVFIFNAGDSRVYKITQERLLHMTHDHSLVQGLVDKSFITEEAAGRHPLKNLVDFGIGPVFESAWQQHDIHMISEKRTAGASYLLCTDGLSSIMSDHEIHECLLPSPVDNGPRLYDAVLRKGLSDNISFIITRIQS